MFCVIMNILFAFFIYAPEEYRMKRVMEVYGDSIEEAKRNIYRSDEARAAYYKIFQGNHGANDTIMIFL